MHKSCLLVRPNFLILPNKLLASFLKQLHIFYIQHILEGHRNIKKYHLIFSFILKEYGLTSILLTCIYFVQTTKKKSISIYYTI